MVNKTGGLQELQHSWTDYARKALNVINSNPKSFIIQSSPYQGWVLNKPLLESLGQLEGKMVLELGCGLGKFSVYMAKQGADVFGIDISHEAIMVARKITSINNEDCNFFVGDVAKIKDIFGEQKFDLVVGVAILHHLPKPDVIKTLQQVHSILRLEGKAVFVESIENSKFFNIIQNIFPAGRKSSGYYRPSLLSRKEWKKYVFELEDRDMTTDELLRAGRIFSSILIDSCGLLSRLDRIIKSKFILFIFQSTDEFIFKSFPFMQKYARNLLVEYRK